MDLFGGSDSGGGGYTPPPPNDLGQGQGNPSHNVLAKGSARFAAPAASYGEDGAEYTSMMASPAGGSAFNVLLPSPSVGSFEPQLYVTNTAETPLFNDLYGVDGIYKYATGDVYQGENQLLGNKRPPGTWTKQPIGPAGGSYGNSGGGGYRTFGTKGGGGGGGPGPRFSGGPGG